MTHSFDDSGADHNEWTTAVYVRQPLAISARFRRWFAMLHQLAELAYHRRLLAYAFTVERAKDPSRKWKASRSEWCLRTIIRG